MQSNQNEQLIMNCHLSKDVIYDFLAKCDDLFRIKLSSLVDLPMYSNKLAKNSKQNCYYVNGELAAILIYYSNNIDEGKAFIPIICTASEHLRKGFANRLVQVTLNMLVSIGFDSVGLEVHIPNTKSIRLFLKNGFRIVSETPELYMFEKDLRIGKIDSDSNYMKFQFV